VIFNGEQLLFPGYSDSESIVQAKRQAEWLNQWLNSNLGENIHVYPLLIIPGWNIDNRAKSVEIHITNGMNVASISEMNSDAPLSKTEIKQITQQLGRICTTPCFKL
jgi:hypothetical protein